MAKRKVRFLQYMSRPRVILIFEIDTVVVTFFVFAISYYVMSAMGFLIIFALTASVFAAYFFAKQYTKIKENSTKGFIFHFLYKHGIWTIKEDPKKYPELKYIDIKQIVPDGNSKDFID